MLLMRTFLKNLTMFGVSTFSLLCATIYWLLGESGPVWPSFLKSPCLLFFTQGGCNFLSATDFTFSLCKKRKNKKFKEKLMVAGHMIYQECRLISTSNVAIYVV
jgi:hypothetical protein